MNEATRSYRFELTIFVEPGHVAHVDPEWAADAAASALTDGYGIDAYYDDIATLDHDEASTKLGDPFPGHDRINHTLADLTVIVSQQRPDRELKKRRWRASRAEW